MHEPTCATRVHYIRVSFSHPYRETVQLDLLATQPLATHPWDGLHTHNRLHMPAPLLISFRPLSLSLAPVLWLCCCCGSEQGAGDEDGWSRRGMRRRGRRKTAGCGGRVAKEGVARYRTAVGGWTASRAACHRETHFSTEKSAVSHEWVAGLNVAIVAVWRERPMTCCFSHGVQVEGWDTAHASVLFFLPRHHHRLSTLSCCAGSCRSRMSRLMLLGSIKQNNAPRHGEQIKSFNMAMLAPHPATASLSQLQPRHSAARME